MKLYFFIILLLCNLVMSGWMLRIPTQVYPKHHALSLKMLDVLKVIHFMVPNDYSSLTCLSRILAVVSPLASSYPGGGSSGAAGGCWLVLPFGLIGVGLCTLGPGAAAVAGVAADFSFLYPPSGTGAGCVDRDGGITVRSLPLPKASS